MNAIISIVIPLYNNQEFLSDCLNSIVMQYSNKIEVIIINDGSTDKSDEIAKRYARRYYWIQIIHQDNSGVLLARNIGLSKTKGKYVLFLDADDYLAQGALNYLLDVVVNGTYDIIFFDLKLIGQTALFKSKPYLPKIKPDSNIAKAIFLDNKSLAGYMGGKLIKKSIAEQAVNTIKYRSERLELYEDCLFLFCVSIYCKTALTLKKKMYIYRIHENSTTQKKIILKQKIKKLRTAELYFEALEETLIIEADPYSKRILSKIIKVINSSILIQDAKKSNYLINVYKAWLLDSRLINLARIVIYLVTFGRIKK